MRCPTCRAEQEWSDNCRRCRCDLQLLREVEEETGYRCEVVEPLDRAQYWFKRDNTLTKKTVTWYLMRPLRQTGEPDPEEIVETEWVTPDEAKKRARYKSDKQLLARLSQRSL